MLLRIDKKELARLSVGSSTWMLKYPVIRNGCGVVAIEVSRDVNSDVKVVKVLV